MKKANQNGWHGYMNQDQKNSYRRFIRAARKAGAVKFQRGYHGCGKWSAQGFDQAGKLVTDWNL